MGLSLRIASGLAVAALIVAAAICLSGGAARDLGLSFALGAAFGVVLQRVRFCFFCNLRDYAEGRDAGGVLAILVALAVGAAGYAAIFGAWMPSPDPARLPPDAHVGPVSWVLPVAGLVFGLGMAVSGSCISAHLYRLGEGSPTAPFALIGALAGFVFGFLTWNDLYVLAIATAKPVWLPHHIGYGGTLGLTMAMLTALALLVLARARASDAPAASRGTPLRAALARIFVARWPSALGGVLVGAIATIAYLRVAPLGVTAELGSIARGAAAKGGVLPETLHGLEGLRGCVTAVKSALLSKNGVFVLGLVGGSFAAALLAGAFKPAWPKPGQIARGLLGGALMGWAAMTALGCTIGVLLSGIHAGALAGWIFLAACAAGVLAGLRFAPSPNKPRHTREGGCPSSSR